MGFSSILGNTAVSTGSTRSEWSNLEWQKKKDSLGRDGTSTYKNGNYCGPGWGFTYHDILDGKIKEMPAAIDAIDEACKRHDLCYHENGYFTQECNTVLTVDLVKVISSGSSTPQQRLDAALMAAIFAYEAIVIDGKLKPAALTVQQLNKIRDRMLAHIANGMASMEDAIKREVLNRSMMRMP
jgi:hypothetical protein